MKTLTKTFITIFALVVAVCYTNAQDQLHFEGLYAEAGCVIIKNHGFISLSFMILFFHSARIF
jgi:hypothetical protein